MNSSVTAESETSVMSSSCFAMSESSRSNGPSKFVSATRKPGADASATPSSAGTVAGALLPPGALPGALTPGTLSPDRRSSEAGSASGDRATEDQLPRELPVRLRRLVVGRELGDGRRRDGGVGELHGAGDHRLEHLLAEGVDDALEHLTGVQRARVVHGGQDAVELDGGVQPVAHLVDRLNEERDAAQGEVLALERDDHAVAGGQRVH